MEKKLKKLYNECVNELNSVGIDILNSSLIGDIDVKIAKRNAKRYGCCKHEDPDEKSEYYEKRGKRRVTKYRRFNKHHIEISKWVMELNDNIIKNTLMHEIIHCFPNCNNHGSEFKKYAKYINEKLGYNIERLGNKEEDYKDSNVEYISEENTYNYIVRCKDCGYSFYRKRLMKNFIRNYRCGKCKGKFIIIKK